MFTNNFEAVLSAALFVGAVGGTALLPTDLFGHPPCDRTSQNTPPVTGDIEELCDCLSAVDQPTKNAPPAAGGKDGPKDGELWDFSGTVIATVV